MYLSCATDQQLLILESLFTLLRPEPDTTVQFLGAFRIVAKGSCMQAVFTSWLMKQS